MTTNLPNSKGYFGEYGGSFLPETLQKIIDEITESYLSIRKLFKKLLMK